MPGVATGQVFTEDELEILEVWARHLKPSPQTFLPEELALIEKIRAYRAELEACRVPR